MRALLGTALDGFVRNEPVISATALIPAAGVPPSRDVALIRVLHTHGQPVERHIAILRQVKNILMAVSDKAL